MQGPSGTNETTYAAIKSSIEGSLVQLGRGSGITPEQRANMAMVIAAPLAFIVEEAIHEAVEPFQARAEAAERLNGELVEALYGFMRDPDVTSVCGAELFDRADALLARVGESK